MNTKFRMKKQMKYLSIIVIAFLLFIGSRGEQVSAASEEEENFANVIVSTTDICALARATAVPEKPYKVVNVINGVHVYWAAVEGVEKYGVWRSETGRDGAYVWLGNPKDIHFTDIKVESGKTYFYKISSVVPGTNEHTEKSEAIGITYVSTPDIIKRCNIESGVMLSWNRIDGATGYAVYRKNFEENDAWTRIGTIEGNETLEWTDTSVREQNGEAYRYTIRALAGGDRKTLSGCRGVGRTMVRLNDIELVYAVAKGVSATVSWEQVSNVSGYEICFKDTGGKETTVRLGDCAIGTRNFAELAEKMHYIVAVRSYKSVEGIGTFYSSWSGPMEIITGEAPVIEVPSKPHKIANIVNGVRIYWESVEGIEKYGVWRSETGRDGTYVWLGNTTTTNFIDKNVKSGNTYFYKVTSMDIGSGKHSEKSEAIGIIYVSTPDITGRENVKDGILLKWGEIDGATGYAIYRKSYDGNDVWVRLGTVTGNKNFTWKDTSVKGEDGAVYRYTVRALAGNDLKTLSGCRNMGRTMVRLQETIMNSVISSGPNSVQCEWAAVSSATGYELRFVDATGKVLSRTIVGSKKLTMEVQELALNTKYNVQVRSFICLDGVGTFYSAWSERSQVSTWVSKPQNYERYKDIWLMIYNDKSRWGMWDLTYAEFLEIYDSIGTENDLFIKMLKEKGPRHTDSTIFYEFDGMKNLEINFPDVETEKIYALHYAPFEYNSEDLESGNYGKSENEAFLDHGGVCGILSNTYLIFIRDILGETDWKYCKYGNMDANHEVLLVKTEDEKVFQVDNCGVDYWWLGLEFRPDYEKIGIVESDAEVMQNFEQWLEEFDTLDRVYWYTFSFFHHYNYETKEWNRRPVWLGFDTGKFSSYLGIDVPKYYTVTYRGLPGKVISMAGYTNLDGYVELKSLVFE